MTTPRAEVPGPAVLIRASLPTTPHHLTEWELASIWGWELGQLNVGHPPSAASDWERKGKKWAYAGCQ